MTRRSPYFSPSLNGSSLPGGTVSSAIRQHPANQPPAAAMASDDSQTEVECMDFLRIFLLFIKLS